MPNKIRKIVVVGGGSSGWMSAATLINFFPKLDVVVIESPDVPTVGVGESTLGRIRVWTHALDLDEKDFMRHTNASYKLSIKFTDFFNKDAGSFHYPFGLPVLTDAPNGLGEWPLKKVFYPETPVEDYCRTYYSQMPLIERRKFTRNEDGALDGFRPHVDVAYHFDAALFGQWLKDRYCLPRGVKHLARTVVEVPVDDDGVKHLRLDDGEIVTADLFVDCTGWKSMLLGEALKEPFQPWTHVLPNNKAWAVQIPYVDKDKELEPYTNCTAIGNGWVWNIPLWSRLGTGYVYSDKFIDDAAALEEFKRHLMSDKMTVPRTRAQVDACSFRPIKMRIGIHERTWVKNVVAIGLSAGFIEPLESNGLFTVHEFLFKLVDTLQREYVAQWDRDVYNTGTKWIFNSFAEFVGLHYALSVRDDTDYWKTLSRKTFDPGMVRLEATDVRSEFTTLADRKIFRNRHEGVQSGLHCIATGMRYFVMHPSNVLYAQFQRNEDIKAHVDQFVFLRKMRQDQWERVAAAAPSLREYLEANIHGADG